MRNKHQSDHLSVAKSKTPSKHDANLQKNSILYFQIGLILCLLATFSLFEMRFENEIITLDTAEYDTETIEYTIENVKVYKDEVKKEEKKELPKKKLTDIYIEKNDDFEDIEKTIFTPNNNDDTPSKNTKEPDITIIEIPDVVPVAAVEFVPVFPGCESYKLNSERYKCLNTKLAKLVQKKFDTDIASEYGLHGTQRIFVQFKVDKTGAITDIKTRAPHPKLDEEAKKLANKIPAMEPGKMGVTPVNVIYNLPIVFQVVD